MLLDERLKRPCKYGHDRSIEGLSGRNCRACKKLSYKKIYRENEKRKYKKNYSYNRASRYGITEKDYQEMLVLQNFRCKICKILESDFKRSLAIDHDHKTNKIRGLLCLRCNLMIGYAKDEVKILQEAIEYLNQ